MHQVQGMLHWGLAVRSHTTAKHHQSTNSRQKNQILEFFDELLKILQSMRTVRSRRLLTPCPCSRRVNGC